MKRITLLLCLCLLLCCAASGALAATIAVESATISPQTTELELNDSYEFTVTIVFADESVGKNVAGMSMEMFTMMTIDTANSSWTDGTNTGDISEGATWLNIPAGGLQKRYVFTMAVTPIYDGPNEGYFRINIHPNTPDINETETISFSMDVFNKDLPAVAIRRITPGDGSVSIYWEDVASPGTRPITTLEYSYDGGQTWHTSSVYTPEIIIKGLTNGQTYTFLVQATNIHGTSDTVSIEATPVGSGPAADGDNYADTPAKQPGYQQAVVANVRAHCNVREGPGTEYAIVGQADLAEPLELVQWSADGQWCQVLYAGGTRLGWIYYEFIGA